MEWNSADERLCRHCSNGKKGRKWGHYTCVQCGDQKPRKEFQSIEGKLTKASGRARIRCDACIAKQVQEEQTQEKKRMTEMMMKTPSVNKTDTVDEDDHRYFTKQVHSLQTWLTKHKNAYPKQHSNNLEEKQGRTSRK